jgi:hypothetical protein
MPRKAELFISSKFRIKVRDTIEYIDSYLSKNTNLISEEETASLRHIRSLLEDVISSLNQMRRLQSDRPY